VGLDDEAEAAFASCSAEARRSARRNRHGLEYPIGGLGILLFFKVIKRILALVLISQII
jgi:hypothetical protein